VCGVAVPCLPCCCCWWWGQVCCRGEGWLLLLLLLLLEVCQTWSQGLHALRGTPHTPWQHLLLLLLGVHPPPRWQRGSTWTHELLLLLLLVLVLLVSMCAMCVSRGPGGPQQVGVKGEGQEAGHIPGVVLSLYCCRNLLLCFCHAASSVEKSGSKGSSGTLDERGGGAHCSMMRGAWVGQETCVLLICEDSASRPKSCCGYCLACG